MKSNIFLVLLFLPSSLCAAASSSSNTILHEESINVYSSKLVRIQSDVPVTVHRSDNDDSNISSPRRQENNSAAVVLVTSDCDTSLTNILPVVVITNDDMNNATIMTVTLGVDDIVASTMTFLPSSSTYDVVYYSSTEDEQQASENSDESRRDLVVNNTPCMTEQMCREVSEKRGFQNLYVGEYTTSGCFYKETEYDNAYWSTRGNPADMEKTLTGNRLPLYCKGDVTAGNTVNSSDDTCTTKDQCNKSRLKLGISNFISGDYSTKGCFSKYSTDGTLTAYWGKGGTSKEISQADLPGVQERITCGEGVSNFATGGSKCEFGPMAAYTHTNCDDDDYCELEAGVCTINDGKGFFFGKCMAKPKGEGCIEMYDPVCGCDQNTYDNSCLAAAKGASIARPGECVSDDLVVSAASQELVYIEDESASSATSNAFAVKSFVLGSILSSIVGSAKVVKRSRVMLPQETCTYNVEVFLDRNSFAKIEVDAPKARVVNSIQFKDSITFVNVTD